MIKKWTIGVFITATISMIASLVSIVKTLQGQFDYFSLFIAFSAWFVCTYLVVNRRFFK